MNNSDNMEQKAYLRQHADNIAAFAKTRYARQGRGIVVIGWPESDFPKPEDIPEGIGYTLATSLISDASRESISTDPMLQAVMRYNPEQQAIVSFVNDVAGTMNIHILTAVYGYTN